FHVFGIVHRHTFLLAADIPGSYPSIRIPAFGFALKLQEGIAGLVGLAEHRIGGRQGSITPEKNTIVRQPALIGQIYDQG
ncbi:MAG TPA: hypothetical protein P5233_15250, partial [Candidatus Paceibacterota bacterium]|nr:hypothetical protein [Candidatus Paceibacterota bacterium]